MTIRYTKIRIYFLFVFLILVNNVIKAQAEQNCKSYNDSIIKQIQIIDIGMENIDDKNKLFDQSILTKINSQSGIYVDNAGNEIQAMQSSRNIFLELIQPPKKFYKIYRCYYLNGKIKEAGFSVGNGTCFVGNFYQYDEEGNKTVINMDKKYDEFDYNKVFLWLDKEGYIDLKTGRGRHHINIGYESDKKQWHILISHNEETGLRFQNRTYKLDGYTGKILEKYDMISYE